MALSSAPSSRAILIPLIAIILGTFMVILDNTVVNVALPTLGRVLNSDLSLLQWVITGYMLAQAAVIPLSGWLSDRFGAKRIYLISIVLFTGGSALCGLAINGQMLVATRLLQGVGGGMLMPIGMAVLYRLTPPERRGAIFGLFGLPIMVAPAIGPLLSGYLLQYADWRLIFLINLPVGIVALIVGLRVLPSIPADRSARALDSLGVILGPLAFASLLFGVSQSTSAGWGAPSTLGGVTVGLIALALFVWRELSVADPVLELRVFRGREFSLGIVTQWAAFAAMFGTLFLIPLFLQQVRGYGPLETGLFTLPVAVASAIFMQISGRVFDRIGVRIPVLFGMSLIVAAMWFLSRVGGGTTGFDLLVPMSALGAGMGSMMMPLNTHLLNVAPRDLVGRVTALTSEMQNVVASLAIAIYATVLQARIPIHVAEASSAAGGTATAAMVENATAFAFGDVYRDALVVAAVGWCLVWVIGRSRPDAEPQPAERAAVAELREQVLVGS